ncbi:hypothetical protein DIS24_g10146 [Lasiodiplodia hormozganensis]|uniref:Uncharacterized protein n=1 Tax=Lasiodiplodia hormozganensis TaxID=869390 RepID=A0AA39XQ84_9PEZI|nr:hypothetical protein DIS24_g10146 [Lasiodiplodia hormozganensis]
MASMKSLTRADLRFDNTIEDPEQRRQYRKDLGTCISQLPASCLELNAVFADVSHGFDEHPAVTPHTPDTLCIGIRDLSTRLRHLSLDAVRVSPAIFWPADVEQQQQQQPPSWPQLEVLELILEPVDSYGTFYADPTPSEIAYNAANHTPARPIESITRLVPRPERGLHQLVTAAGRAAFRGGGGMPRLRELRVELPDKCGLAVELFFGQDWKGEGNFRLEWTSRPPVPWTDEIVEAWGIEWNMCEIDSEEADEDGDGGYWNLETMVPWR